MAYQLLTEHKRKLFKILLAAAVLFSVQWTRDWFKGLLEYQVFSDVQLISVLGLGLAYMLWLYHRRDI